MSSSVISMLVEIKNALAAGRDFVELSRSRFREDLAKLLVKEGFLKEVKSFKRGKFTFLHVGLLDRSAPGRQVSWPSLKIISKPGQRIYLSQAQIRRRLSQGQRNIFLSTSRGLLRINEAGQRKLGGEAICELG